MITSNIFTMITNSIIPIINWFHQPFAESLQVCKRYYWKNNTYTFAIKNRFNDSLSANTKISTEILKESKMLFSDKLHQPNKNDY